MHKDRSIGRFVSRKEGRQDQAGRIATEFLLDVCGRKPVGEHPKATTHHPISLAVNIPSGANSWLGGEWRAKQRVVRRLGIAVRYLFIQSRARAKIKVPEDCGGRLRIRRNPRVKVKLCRAFHVSSTKAPHVLEAAFQLHSCCWPVSGLYMTPPSVCGAS